MDLAAITNALVEDIAPLHFGPPVTHVYNPLVYARASHALYLQRFGCGRREVVLVGMNPGPWGMVQTGVPFGDVGMVRDWLGIEAPVGKPSHEHSKRPVLGFGCRRREVSGTRIWGWARDRFSTPEDFFSRFFVVNYCPLAFFEVTGRNRTPGRLPAAEVKPLLAACDLALRRTIECLRPRFVIGVGAFAEVRAREALSGLEVIVARILHPSPANPAANRGWARRITEQLTAYGIRIPAR